MAVPFRRTSKSKKAKRRSHNALKVTGVVTCSNCGELTLSHRVCQNCGYYKNKPVVEIKVKEEN